jgi:putative aldouronate transport system permease protein
MLAIDPQLFEAAKIDGASKWQQYRFITFPMLRPLIVINLLLSLGGIFSADFGLFYQVPRNQALLYPTTDVLDTFIYRSLIELQNVSMAAAANLYQALVGFVLVLTANWVVRRIESEDEPLSLF